MQRSRLILVLLGLASLGGCVRAPEPERSDRPVRICSVNLTADEMLADLVDPARVVAVTTYCDDPGVSSAVDAYPESVRRLAGAEIEVLVDLAPDLVVLSPYHTADFKELMRGSALPRHDLREIRSSADVVTEYLRLGDAVGEADRAREIVAELERRAEALKKALAATTARPRVLFVASQFTAGRGSIIGEMIESAGARNVGAEMDIEGVAAFEPESAIAADPEWVLVSSWKEDSPRELGLLASLPAVVSKRVIELPGPLLNSTTRHWIAAAEALARRLHPDAFPDPDRK